MHHLIVRYMEISLCLYVCKAGRYMENFMYLNMPMLEGTWIFHVLYHVSCVKVLHVHAVLHV